MKQILLIVAFLISIGLSSNAQEYKKMFKDGRVWNYVINTDGEDDARITVTVVGDTIVNDKTKKKLKIDIEGIYYSTYNKWMFDTAYEEDGKVYYGPDDLMIMDFTKHKGYEFCIGLQITKEDSIEVRGVRYRRLVFDNGFANKYFRKYQVEGIGASCCSAILSINIPHCGGEITYLESCYDNGELIFSFDDFEAPAITGIAAVKPSASTDGKAYDLSGRRISQPAKNGIYIKDGRKHLQR